jgi:superfamily I DNA/RNA helicase
MLREDRDDTPRFSWYLHWALPEPRLRFLEEANEWKNKFPDDEHRAFYVGVTRTKKNLHIIQGRPGASYDI